MRRSRQAYAGWRSSLRHRHAERCAMTLDLSQSHIRSKAHRDRLLMLLAIAQSLLTLLVMLLRGPSGDVFVVQGPRASREEGAGWASATDEQRSQTGWIGVRNGKLFLREPLDREGIL